MTIGDALLDALKATGFIIADKPAPGLTIGNTEVQGSDLELDAIWEDRSHLKVLFKYQNGSARPDEIASWHRDAWNLGLAPLLWVVSPQRIEVYNTYDRPTSQNDARPHLLKTFTLIEQELARLDDYAGRLAMASGRFWSNEVRVRRDGRVDIQLLQDLQEVERKLQDGRLNRQFAQSLLGRSIFARYLVDRKIVKSDILKKFGSDDLSGIFDDHAKTYRLFDWMRTTFNGDIFPVSDRERDVVKLKHLRLISQTLAGTSPITGQMSLWAYKFDVIPIELISSIYEQFAHSSEGGEAQGEGLHYTPISLVNLVLDEVLRGVRADARVLDFTCGSGVFLVESFRRLVNLRAQGKPINRDMIRRTLREQIFGVDKNEAAIRVASFSLYLAALELDPDPSPPEALKFEPLIGRNLFAADAFEIGNVPSAKRAFDKPFDVIVGNPPWTYRGIDRGQPVWPAGYHAQPLPPRSQDFAFVWHSLNYADEATRFGVVMRATPFFSNAPASVRARNALLNALRPIALVNLAALRDDLFPTADYPAVVLFARLHSKRRGGMIPLVTIPWTSAFAASGTFEIGPSDVRLVSEAEMQGIQNGLKLASLASPRDRLLLKRLLGETVQLGTWLKGQDLSLETGIQPLEGDRNDASHLLGLPYLESGALNFRINPRVLPTFNKRKIHRPRSRETFRGPLVVVGEGVASGRVVVGLSAGDIVFTRSYYGISLARADKKLGSYLAGIFASAIASWQLLLTAAEFGIHKRKLLRQDLNTLLVPFVRDADLSAARVVGEAYAELATSNSPEQVTRLDHAVFDLYGLEPDERLVVLDGLDRAKREYAAARVSSDQPATSAEIRAYAKAFLSVVNAWQFALGRPKYRAEILALRFNAALRVIRFARGLGQEIGRPHVASDLNDSLSRIGERIKLPIAERLAAARELRIHANDEILIIKPSARRFWTPATGLNDADAALGDGLASEANDSI
jgi:hypothetical protein